MSSTRTTNTASGAKPTLQERLMKGTSPVAKAMTPDEVVSLCQSLVKSKEMHPAFAYAAQKFKALPSTPRRPEFGDAGRVARDEWNAAVEEYIATLPDADAHASRVAAAVDAEGGPLYKRCDLGTCGQLEPAPGQYRVCSACKTAFYCSTDCQRAAWKTHKAQCKAAPTQRLLPSQESMLKLHKMMARMRYLGSAATAQMLQEEYGDRM